MFQTKDINYFSFSGPNRIYTPCDPKRETIIINKFTLKFDSQSSCLAYGLVRSKDNSDDLPLAWLASRSLRPWEISTADTLTENLAPVLCFCSLMPRNSQEMDEGMRPRAEAESGEPSIVCVLPGRRYSYVSKQTYAGFLI